jgi:DNA-binding transcriptional MerR regulator
MDGDTLYSIGDLARRTRLSVRTIRFYSDCGVLPPADRSPAGHRRYGLDALARLDLIRTLRELDVDLATIRRALDREVSIAEVAGVHAEALDVQIRTLRLRRAVLRAVAKRGSSPEEMRLMHKLAKLSDAERRRIVHEFIDDAVDGLDVNPDFVAMMRSAMPELPDDPSPEQVDAWVELAELVQDRDFKASVRRMAEHQAAERAAGEASGSGLHHELTNQLRARIEAALGAGIDPASQQTRPVVADLVARYAETFGKADTLDYRSQLLIRLQTANDPRVERYWQLLATINAWPIPPTLAPVFEWFVQALQHHPDPMTTPA